MTTSTVPVPAPRLLDDLPTLAALGVLAFAIADVSHEALGHGLATLAVGEKPVLLTTCNFDSIGPYSRWIPAAGGLMNIAVGVGALAFLHLFSYITARLRYFLILIAPFNLFFAFGYPAYSGIAAFGDWAAVISALRLQWLWRVVLVLISIIGYYATMRLLAKPLAPFAKSASDPQSQLPDKARLARITLIPYMAAMILASLAGALNPGGWLKMVTAGLPAAAAAFGLTQMDHFAGAALPQDTHPSIKPMQRSYPWIAAAIIVFIVFVGILGPGIRFSPQ